MFQSWFCMLPTMPTVILIKQWMGEKRLSWNYESILCMRWHTLHINTPLKKCITLKIGRGRYTHTLHYTLVHKEIGLIWIYIVNLKTNLLFCSIVKTEWTRCSDSKKKRSLKAISINFVAAILCNNEMRVNLQTLYVINPSVKRIYWLLVGGSILSLIFNGTLLISYRKIGF